MFQNALSATVFESTNCSDFRYESNGIFVFGVGFFFFRQISTFQLDFSTDDFHKKFQILEEKKFHFILFHLILCYYCCSINLKRQSEHLGLRPDTSSLVL